MNIFEILSLCSNQIFEADKIWAMAEIKQLVLQSKLGHSEKYYQELKDQTKLIQFYNMDGGLEAEDIDPSKVVTAANSIAEVSLDGIMMLQDQMCSQGIRGLQNNMRQLYANPNVDGLLMHGNSGGGQSAAGSYLMNAFADSPKPIVVHTTFMGSAFLKGTLPATQVIADSNSTLIGSIGSMFQISREMLAKEKADTLTIKSKHSENKNLDIEDLMDGNIERILEKVTYNDKDFMNAVKKYRNLRGDKAMIKNTLSGEVFNAVEARKRGLIDGIGSIDMARARLFKEISRSK